MDIETTALDIVFGSDSAGTTAQERARTSRREFVRSQDELAVYEPPATGRRISAWEALNTFGFRKLEEAVTSSSALLVSDYRRPATVLRERRIQLGLEPVDLAKRLAVSPQQIVDAENINARTPIRLLEKIAQALGLDETQLVNANAAGGDSELALRLRELRKANKTFGPKAVLTFDEAAWIVSKQNRLYSWVLPTRKTIAQLGFATDSRYGSPNDPTWEYGYRLASQTRNLLGLAAEEPITSLKVLVEKVLSIPLVFAYLPAGVAGATISNGSDRGIVVSLSGENQNVWVRRMTVAHELGHLLWDPDPRLQKLRVDTYREFEHEPLDRTDPVEARANAFAVEFLAPQAAVRKMYQATGGTGQVRQIMEKFGISFTSAKYQIWNSLDRAIPLEEIRTGSVDPTDEWRAVESDTIDFFLPKSVPETRTGYFAGLVAAAEAKNLITTDSAASFLACTEAEYKQHSKTIREIYPEIL